MDNVSAMQLVGFASQTCFEDLSSSCLRNNFCVQDSISRRSRNRTRVYADLECYHMEVVCKGFIQMGLNYVVEVGKCCFRNILQHVFLTMGSRAL
jgi:hypothetical protein